MAWPPPVLPINRTDALYQQGNHPADHNAANVAINDVVARLTGSGAGQLGRLGQLVLGAPVIGAAQPGGALTRMTQDMAIPAGGGQWLVWFNVLVSSTSALNFRMRMYGTVPPGNFDHEIGGPTSMSASFAFIAPAGAAVSVYGINNGAAQVDFSNDGSTTALFAIGLV
jgi:hypothetical protein